MSATEPASLRSKRVIAVGRKVNGRWSIRTSLWRYLATTAVSTQLLLFAVPTVHAWQSAPTSPADAALRGQESAPPAMFWHMPAGTARLADAMLTHLYTFCDGPHRVYWSVSGVSSPAVPAALAVVPWGCRGWMENTVVVEDPKP